MHALVLMTTGPVGITDAVDRDHEQFIDELVEADGSCSAVH